MIYFKILKNIRKEHNLSQGDLAKMTGYTVDYIRSLEENEDSRKLVTPEFVSNLRDKLGLHGVLITDDERDAFEKSLHKWKILIDYGIMDRAAAQMPGLVKSAQACYSPSTQITCSIYVAHYHLATRDMAAFNKTMLELCERKQAFNRKHHFYYQCLVGRYALIEERYKDALVAFDKAEKLEKEDKWSDVTFYYAYGLCLTEMEYINRAIKYLEKALHLAMWQKSYNGKPNKRYSVYIEGLLAQNLGMIGKSEEALAILKRRLNNEMRTKKSRQSIGCTYLVYSKVYDNAGNYTEAMKNLEKAEEYLEEGSEQYLSCLYHKALMLIDSGSASLSMDILDKGLSMSVEGTVWEVLFNALRHSLTLANPESLEYMTNTAVPKLQKYGHREKVLRYCKLIARFHQENSNFTQAFEFLNLTLDICEQFYKERVI